MRCSDDAENRRIAPQLFPGFPIIKLARRCGKITIFFLKCAFYGNGFRSGGTFMYALILGMIFCSPPNASEWG
jgi:hypothetical protein